MVQLITFPQSLFGLVLLVGCALGGLAMLGSDAMGAPVPPDSALADLVPPNGIERRGVVHVVGTSGTGHHDPSYQSIDDWSAYLTQGSPPQATLTVTPRFVGYVMEARIDPGTGADHHSIEVTTKEVDVGDDATPPVNEFLLVNLHVWFDGQEDEEYNVTWTSDSMSVRWDGYIHLPNNASNGTTKFRVWTSAPYAPGNPPALVPVRINPDGGAGDKYKWEIQKSGVHSADFDKLIENDDLALLDHSKGSALAYSERVTGLGSQQQTKQECQVLLQVKLNHSVIAEQIGMEFKSRTDEWEVYNWRLTVAIDKP